MIRISTVSMFYFPIVQVTPYARNFMTPYSLVCIKSVESAMHFNLIDYIFIGFLPTD